MLLGTLIPLVISWFIVFSIAISPIFDFCYNKIRLLIKSEMYFTDR